MELKTYLKSLWRSTPWLILGAIVAAAISVALSIYVLEPVYDASVTLIVSYGSPSAQESSYSATLTSERLANTYAVLITNPEVLQRGIDVAGANVDPATLLQRLKVESPLDTSVINLTVEDPDARQAARLANGIASAFVEYVSEMQSEMGIESSLLQTSDYYQTSKERADLAAALDSYVRSYGDLVGIYVSLTNEIRARDIVEIVYSKTELDGMGLNIRQQMTDTLAAIASLESEIAEVEGQQPVVGMTRPEWYDERSRLEQLVNERRSLYHGMLGMETSLLETQLAQEQSDLSTLMQQRDMELAAQINGAPPPPPLPAATPGPRIFTSQLTTVISETQLVLSALHESEQNLANHLATTPIERIIMQQEIDTHLESLRSELRQKRSGYATLANSYITYVQFLQANERPETPFEDIADFEGRRERISGEADLIWQQILDLRVRLKELDHRMFAPPGPPLVVSGIAMPAAEPARPDPVLNGIIAAAAALILITLVVLLVAYMRVTDERPIGAGV